MPYNVFRRALTAGALTLALSPDALAQVRIYENEIGNVSCTVEDYVPRVTLPRVTCIDAQPRKAYATVTEDDQLKWFAEGKDSFYVSGKLTKEQKKSKNPRYVLPTDKRAKGMKTRHEGMLRETGARIN